jgi:signal transduction histidine kinase
VADLDISSSVRVLIVEDSEDDFDLIVLKLRQAGLGPIALRVETLAEVKKALLQDDWQMVFSDFDLPGFDGLRVLQLVREANRDLPFFIVSGVIDEEQAVAAVKAGAQDYFFKGKLGRLAPAVARELEEAEQRRKRRDQQATLDRDRDILRHDRIRFVDVMSHELRTPLNIINVAAGMLARYGERMDVAGRQERSAEIQEGVARMIRIMDKVLLTSRLELRRWDLKSETFELGKWCENLLANGMPDSSQTPRIRLKLLDLPLKVAMDQRVLEIALQNMLSNALKYSPPEAPVDLEVARDASGRIEFTVRDCGIGIPESDLCHVWESFYRASNVGEVQGTGLGLAIVKGCTELHGGTLEIESKPGSGTCVRMYLPDWLLVRGAGEKALASQAGITKP